MAYADVIAAIGIQRKLCQQHPPLCHVMNVGNHIVKYTCIRVIKCCTLSVCLSVLQFTLNRKLW